jgi:hypothetical protein
MWDANNAVFTGKWNNSHLSHTKWPRRHERLYQAQVLGATCLFPESQIWASDSKIYVFCAKGNAIALQTGFLRVK